MKMTSWSDLDPVFELELSAGIDGHALERLTGLVVGLAGALENLENGALIYAPRGVGGDGAGDRELGTRTVSETYLKRFMRSNISSLETSGYFFCSRKASMVVVDEMGRDGAVYSTARLRC